MRRYLFSKKTKELIGDTDILPDRIPRDYYIDSEPITFPELQDGQKIVYDEVIGFKILNKKEWRILQSELGNDDPITSNQKFDENSQLVQKTQKELYSEKLITNAQYIEYLTNEIELFYNNQILHGTIHDGCRFRCDETSKGRISEAVLEMQTFPSDKVTAWISECKVNSNGIDIDGTENYQYQITSDQMLLDLAKAIKDFWKICFYTRRLMLDDLPNKTDLELEQYDISSEWVVYFNGLVP